MTRNKAYIVMDVGGTFIKSGIMSADGVLLDASQQTVPINSDGTKEEICNSLTSAVCQGISLARYYGYSPAGVGICMPGPFNYITGISNMVHKFAAIKDLPLTDVIKEALDGLDVPIVFGHDVNTQLFGEMCGGNGMGFANVCLVSLGTGLGFAMAAEGNVLMTPTGSPLVSIWNLPYNGDILEDYASKRVFYNTWQMVRTNLHKKRKFIQLQSKKWAHSCNERSYKILEDINSISEEASPSWSQYEISSTKTGIFVDGTCKMSVPSIKRAVFMDKLFITEPRYHTWA